MKVKNILLSLMLLYSINSDNLSYQNIAKSRKPSIEKVLYDDPKWEYTMEKTAELYEKTYNSGKRLPNPVYFNGTAFMMPIHDSEIEVPWDFINAITKHIENSLENNMADWIFLPDMGHGHFYLPKEVKGYDWKTIIDNYKDAKLLYHTAEMFLFFGSKEEFLKLPADEQERNIRRNVVGNFKYSGVEFIGYPFGHPVVSDFDDNLRRVAPDIDISASKDGQFPFRYKGKVCYFDISSFSPQSY